jgi:hypothetical protein
VYTTGTLDAEEYDPVLIQDGKVLLKPYSPDRLLQAIGSCFTSQAPQRG